MEATDFDLERPPFPEPFEAIEALDSLRSNFRGILNTTEIQNPLSVIIWFHVRENCVVDKRLSADVGRKFFYLPNREI